jgi:hypothetical protein
MWKIDQKQFFGENKEKSHEEKIANRTVPTFLRQLGP